MHNPPPFLAYPFEEKLNRGDKSCRGVKAGLFVQPKKRSVRDCSTSEIEAAVDTSHGEREGKERGEFRGTKRDKRRINRELIAVVRGDGYQGILRGE